MLDPKKQLELAKGEYQQQRYPGDLADDLADVLLGSTQIDQATSDRQPTGPLPTSQPFSAGRKASISHNLIRVALLASLMIGCSLGLYYLFALAGNDPRPTPIAKADSATSVDHRPVLSPAAVTLKSRPVSLRWSNQRTDRPTELLRWHTANISGRPQAIQRKSSPTGHSVFRFPQSRQETQRSRLSFSPQDQSTADRKSKSVEMFNFRPKRPPIAGKNFAAKQPTADKGRKQSGQHGPRKSRLLASHQIKSIRRFHFRRFNHAF